MDKSIKIQFVGDLARLELRKGDYLVLTIPELMSDSEIHLTQQQMAKLFPNNRTFILTGGISLGVVSSGQED